MSFNQNSAHDILQPSSDITGNPNNSQSSSRSIARAISTAISPPKKQISTPMPSPKRIIATASSQKCTPGTNKNKHNAKTFVSPKIKAGTLRRPPNSLSEITPENNGADNTTNRTNGNNETGIQSGISFLCFQIKNSPTVYRISADIHKCT